MSDETIKLKEEPNNQAPQAPDAFNTRQSQDTTDFLETKDLFPVNTAMVGRSIKMRDVFNLSGVCAVSSSIVTVANTVTETNLGTFTFNPNEYHTGMVVRISALGTYSGLGTDTIKILVGVGGAPVTEWNSMTSTAAVATNQPWNLIWTGIITALGSSGTLEAQMTGRINNVNIDDPNTGTVALDTTIRNIFTVSAKWSAASASDTISIRQFIIEILN